MGCLSLRLKHASHPVMNSKGWCLKQFYFSENSAEGV